MLFTSLYSWTVCILIFRGWEHQDPRIDRSNTLIFWCILLQILSYWPLYCGGPYTISCKFTFFFTVLLWEWLNELGTCSTKPHYIAFAIYFIYYKYDFQLHLDFVMHWVAQVTGQSCLTLWGGIGAVTMPKNPGAHVELRVDLTKV